MRSARSFEHLLEDGLKSPANLNPSVELSNPADETDEKTLSIWLYQVTANGYLRNIPNVRDAG